MPSDTFFRLPEEKRSRILDAAWEEFTSVSFDQVSINRIIRAANIPRGSFYQYFDGKTELFRFLAEDMKQFALDGFLSVLRDNQGDLLVSILDSYDRLRALQGLPVIKPVDNAVAFLKMNPGLDLQSLITRDQSWMNPVWEQIDTRMLKKQTREYLYTVFHLCSLALCSAALDSLVCPEHWERNREWLSNAILIMQFGCMDASAPAIS